ncbi:Glutamate decarboxylase [Corynebacterium heidelbergense]|nr:Glutamate decarboxylase [Corynebacterium heidelbergense]
MEHQVLDGHDLDAYVDENTIGVVAIMGVTDTGMYEPVVQIADVSDAIETERGWDIPIRVDGASGAMVASVLQAGLEWDFRGGPSGLYLPVWAQVRSGLSRPGSQVLLQYYLFVRLGFEGYRKV